MFSTETNGYNKKEVKERFNQLLLEISNLKNNNNQLNKLNSTLLTTLTKTKEIEANARKVNNLKFQKIQIIFQTLEKSVNKLLSKYPQISNMSDIQDEFEDFAANLKDILEDNPKESNSSVHSPVRTENDTIRLLLNKMGAYPKIQEQPKQVIKRKDSHKETRLGRNFKLPTDLNDTAPQEEKEIFKRKQNSGFDLREAVNPKIDLDEIMKAFDLDE